MDDCLKIEGNKIYYFDRYNHVDFFYNKGIGIVLMFNNVPAKPKTKCWDMYYLNISHREIYESIYEQN